MRQLTVYCPHGLAMVTTAEISQLTSPENIYMESRITQPKWKINTQSLFFNTLSPDASCVCITILLGRMGCVFFFRVFRLKKNSEKKPPHHHLLVFFPKDLSRGTCWRLEGLPRSRWVTVSRFSRRAGKRNQQWRFFSPNRNDGLEDCIFIYIYTFVFWNGHPFLRVTCSFLKGCVCRFCSRFSRGGSPEETFDAIFWGWGGMFLWFVFTFRTKVSQGFIFLQFLGLLSFSQGEDPKKTSQISSQKPRLLRKKWWKLLSHQFCCLQKKKFTKKPGSLNEICDLLMAC